MRGAGPRVVPDDVERRLRGVPRRAGVEGFQPDPECARRAPPDARTAAARAPGAFVPARLTVVLLEGFEERSPGRVGSRTLSERRLDRTQDRAGDRRRRPRDTELSRDPAGEKARSEER